MPGISKNNKNMETNLSFTLDDHSIRTKAGHAEQLYSGGQ